MPWRSPRPAWQGRLRPRRSAALSPPFYTLPAHFLDQRRIGVPQIHEIDIVRDRAVLDIGRKLGEEGERKPVPRQHSDIDIAMLSHIPARARPEQPDFGLAVAERV